MSDSWTPVHLADIFTPRRGISYSANDLKDADGTGSPFITIKNFNKGGGFNHKGLKTYSGPDFPMQRLEPEALLIANTDVTRDAEIIGAPLLVPALDERPLFSMDVNQLTPTGKLGYVDPRYIFFRLCIADARSHMQKVSAGSTVLHLNVKDALKFRFDLPPVSEQVTIAQILDTLDTQIQKTEALVVKLEKIKEGLLHDLLTRGIDQNGQLRPAPEQAPELYKKSALGLIPKEWEITPLGQVAESMIDGPFGSNLKTSHYVEEAGVQVVRLQNIKTGEYDETSTAFITRAHANKLDKNQVVSGDLLVAALGDEKSKPGRACLYPTHLPPAINKADCFRVRAQPSKTTNSFLMHSLNFERSSKQATAKQQGVTLQRVNLSNLRTVVISLPTIAEQKLISDKLNAIAGEISALEYERQKLESTKSGLMDDLLTGRVRVTPLLKDAV